MYNSIAVYFKHGNVFRCDIWRGSVERAIDLDIEGTLQQTIIANSATNKNKRPFYSGGRQ
jgi:hypothetical protein